MNWQQAIEVMTQARAHVPISRCIGIGARQFLFEIAQSVHAKNVIEVGTYTGLSALVLSLAVGPDGRVETVDVDDVNAEGSWWESDDVPTGRPSTMMRRAGVTNVRFIHADGLVYLRRTQQSYDFAFLDASKHSDVTYEEVHALVPKMRPNSVIVLDDVFPNGEPMVENGYSDLGPWQALERLKADYLDVRYHSAAPNGEQIRMGSIWLG